MAILNRFSAILLYCDSTHFFASRCGISGDSGPAILGIVRFAIRDSVPLRSVAYRGKSGQNFPKNTDAAFLAFGLGVVRHLLKRGRTPTICDLELFGFLSGRVGL